MPAFTDEINLLLLSEQPANSALPRLIESPSLNWQHIVDLSLLHRTYPRLFSYIKPYSALIPEPLYQCLVERFMMNARQALMLANTLNALLHDFESAGIDTLPFKGPTLALAAYGQITLRHAGDLDLLVDRQSVGRACALLRDHGFIDLTTPVHRERGLRDLYHFRLKHPPSSLQVEVHWAFSRPTLPIALDLAKLLPRAVPMPLGDSAIRAISPEDLLLILCLHGGKHLWTHLTWITDVAGLLRHHPAFDWDTALHRADQLGCARLLHIGLDLAHRLIATPLPADVLRRIERDAEARALSEQFAEHLFDADRPLLLTHLEEDEWFIRLRERRRDRAQWLYHAVWRRMIRRIVRRIRGA